LHADIAGDRREQGAHQEEDRAAYPLRGGVRREQHEQEERHDGEDPEGAELPCEVGVGAFLHGSGDPFHAVRALVGGEHFTYQHRGERECRQSDDDNNPD
jgi:hypothetical protein